MNVELRMAWWQRCVVIFILYSLFLFPVIASAAIIPDCDPIPSKTNPCSAKHLFELLVNIYNFLLGMAGLVVMLLIVFGGVRMLYFSYMENSAGELEESKLTVRRAISGFIIIALAYLLVNTVLTMLGVAPGSQVGKLLSDLGLFRKP